MVLVFCFIAALLIAAGIFAATRKSLTAGVTLVTVGMLAVAGGAARMFG